jgi:hypothetical protein
MPFLCTVYYNTMSYFCFLTVIFIFFWLQGAGRPDVELSAAQAT